MTTAKELGEKAARMKADAIYARLLRHTQEAEMAKKSSHPPPEPHLVTAKTIAMFTAQATLCFEERDALATTIEEYGGELCLVSEGLIVVINLDWDHWVITKVGETKLYTTNRRLSPKQLLEAIATGKSTLVRLVATIPNEVR